MGKRIDPWWITVGEGDLTGTCETCGAKLRVGLPIAVSVWCAAAREFVKVHTRCGPPKGKCVDCHKDLTGNEKTVCDDCMPF